MKMCDPLEGGAHCRGGAPFRGDLGMFNSVAVDDPGGSDQKVKSEAYLITYKGITDRLDKLNMQEI